MLGIYKDKEKPETILYTLGLQDNYFLIISFPVFIFLSIVLSLLIFPDAVDLYLLFLCVHEGINYFEISSDPIFH